MNENTQNPVMETAIKLLKSVRENIEFTGNNNAKKQRLGSEWAGYCNGIRDACWVIDDFIKSIEKKMT